VTIIITIDDRAPPVPLPYVKQAVLGSAEEPARRVCVLRSFGDGVVEFKGLSEGHYEQKVGLGRSIALKGDNNPAGTLGGYIKLEKPSGEEKILALTCWHVVRPSEDKNVEGKFSRIVTGSPTHTI
jgi:hypothetical protein